jgi:hypothetical protein
MNNTFFSIILILPLDHYNNIGTCTSTFSQIRSYLCWIFWFSGTHFTFSHAPCVRLNAIKGGEISTPLKWASISIEWKMPTALNGFSMTLYLKLKHNISTEEQILHSPRTLHSEEEYLIWWQQNNFIIIIIEVIETRLSTIISLQHVHVQERVHTW